MTAVHAFAGSKCVVLYVSVKITIEVCIVVTLICQNLKTLIQTAPFIKQATGICGSSKLHAHLGHATLVLICCDKYKSNTFKKSDHYYHLIVSVLILV